MATLTGGFGFPLGCASAVVAAIGADVARATTHPLYALVPLALVVLAAGVVTTPVAAAGAATVAWGLDAGFVLGREGHLVLDAPSGRAALVLAVALAAGVLARPAALTAFRARGRRVAAAASPPEGTLCRSLPIRQQPHRKPLAPGIRSRSDPPASGRTG